MRPAPEWLALIFALLIVLAYAFIGVATTKAIRPRFTAAGDHPDYPGLCGAFWPIYWVCRGMDAATAWAEPAPAVEAP